MGSDLPRIRALTQRYLTILGLLGLTSLVVYLSFFEIVDPIRWYTQAMSWLGDRAVLLERADRRATEYASPHISAKEKQKIYAVLQDLEHSLIPEEKIPFEDEQFFSDVAQLYGKKFKNPVSEIKKSLQKVDYSLESLLAAKTPKQIDLAKADIEKSFVYGFIPHSLNLSSIMEKVINQHLLSFRWWVTISGSFLLVGLILSGLFIFVPIIRRVRRNDELLKEANAVLNNRAKELAKSRSTLSNQLRLSESILNNMEEGVLYVDPSGRFLERNLTFIRFWEKISPESARASHIKEFHKHVLFFNKENEQPILVQNLPLAKALLGKKASGEFLVCRREEKVNFDKCSTVEFSAVPIWGDNQNIEGGLLVFRDISSQVITRGKLERAEQRYRDLWERADEVVYSVDTEGIITSLNKSFTRITGFPTEQWIGKHYEGFYLPEDIPKGRELFKLAKEDKFPPREEVRIIGKNGQILTMEVTPPMPIMDHDKIVGFWGIAHDVTAKKEVEGKIKRSQDLLVRAFRAAPTAMGIANVEGRFIDVNEYFMALVNLPREQIIGKTSLELGIWSNIEARKDMLFNLNQHGSVREMELTMISSLGQTLDLIGSFELIDFNEQTCVLGMIRDVTEQKLARKRLEEAKKVSDAANKAKSEFLANISHEIRTPLSAISGYLEMLAQEVTQSEHQSSVRQSLKHMARIKYNIKNVTQLIEDILDISKVEAGKLMVERIRFSPAKELSEVYHFLNEQAVSQGLDFKLKFEGPLPKEIHSDPMRLKQILINIVGNAIKFTDQGAVSVIVSASKKSKRCLLKVVVQDTGCGMHETEKKRLFAPFVQGDSSTTRKYGGTGLGLSLSKKLARSLGGDLTLEYSEPGKGSRFCLVIDVGKSSELQFTHTFSEDETISPSEQVKSKKIDRQLYSIRVVLVEDGLDNQIVIRHFLERAGAQVYVAENGVRGVEEILTLDPDIVLMDLQMPVMGGYEATQRLRVLGYKKPIIALTAAAMKGEKERCLQEGFDEYVTKPFEAQELIQIISSQVKSLLFKKVLPSQSDLNSGEQLLFSDHSSDPSMKVLLEGFIGRLPLRLEKFKSSLKDQDWKKLKHLAHQFKGAAGGFGYPPLQVSAADLEKVCEEKNEMKAREVIGVLEDQAKRATLAIQREPQSNAS